MLRRLLTSSLRRPIQGTRARGRPLCTPTSSSGGEKKTLSEAELAAFRRWQKSQSSSSSSSSSSSWKPPPAKHPRLAAVGAVALTAAAATPFILLAPVSGVVVLAETFVAFLGANGYAPDGLPFYTTRGSLALAAHPAVTVTCGLANAAAFALCPSFLNNATPGAWKHASFEAVAEAAAVGRKVGFRAALAAPIFLFSMHRLLTKEIPTATGGYTLPRSLIMEFWAGSGDLGQFTFYATTFIVGVPLCTVVGGMIGRTILTRLYSGAGGLPSVQGLILPAAAVLGTMTTMSLTMHGTWEKNQLAAFGTQGPASRDMTAHHPAHHPNPQQVMSLLICSSRL